MLYFDLLTIVGLISAATVVVVLFVLCKLRGCNKPIC